MRSHAQPPRFSRHRRRPHVRADALRPMRFRSSTKRSPTRRRPAPSPNVWVTIAPDGTITIVSPAAEMGQGTFTTAAADPRRRTRRRLVEGQAGHAADWDDKKLRQSGIRLQFPAPRPASPARGYFKPMRIAGAQARRVLLDAVAAKWSVPVGELSTEPSVVVHKASGRRIGYGEIAAFAKAPAELPKIEDRDLKAAGAASATSARTCRASRCRSRSPAPPNTASTCRCRAWSTPRCCNRPIRAARRETVDDAARRARCRHHRRGAAAGRRRRRRHHRRGDAGGQEPAQGHLVASARRAATTANARSTSSRPSPATRAARASPYGKAGDAKAAHGGRRARCSAANIAPAMSITPRWSR